MGHHKPHRPVHMPVAAYNVIQPPDLSRLELFNNRFEWIAAVDWRGRTEKRAGISTADCFRRKALVQAALRRLYRNFDDLLAAA